MEVISQSLSKWFYLGAISVVIGAVLIFMARGQNKSKRMENGYFLLILGFVGVISEWTDFATVLFIFVIIASFWKILPQKMAKNCGNWEGFPQARLSSFLS